MLSPLLQDLVTALTNSLENGDLYIDLSDKLQPNGIKEAGWPEAHRKVLLESGWLNDNSSPIILTGSQLSWRRWHSDMNDLIQNLLERSKLKHSPLDNSLTKGLSTDIEELNQKQKDG